MRYVNEPVNQSVSRANDLSINRSGNQNDSDRSIETKKLLSSKIFQAINLISVMCSIDGNEKSTFSRMEHPSSRLPQTIATSFRCSATTADGKCTEVAW